MMTARSATTVRARTGVALPLANRTTGTVRRVSAFNKMIVRAQGEDVKEPAQLASEEQMISASPQAQAMAAVVPADQEVFTVFGMVQEAINGRAAMLGFLTAVIAERITHQSVVSQIAGRYVNYELVEPALGVSDLSYGFMVALVSLATFAPLVFNGEKPGSRSFGPFTSGLETTMGRAAMIGFAGLCLVEVVKGNTPLF